MMSSLISETLFAKDALTSGLLTIAVPTYRDDPTALVSALAKCKSADEISCSSMMMAQETSS